MRLIPDDVVKIEEMVGGGSVAWVRDEGLSVASTEGHAFELTLRNLATQRTEFLRFDEVAGLGAVAFRYDAFEPDWEIRADHHWVRSVGDWAGRWFEGLGKHNHIGRTNNALMEVEVTEDKATIRFNRVSAAADFPVAVDVFGDVAATLFESSDLAPVLYRLGHACPVSGAAISGNRHALVCQYETAIGDFAMAVPAYDEQTKGRDGSLFFREIL